MKTKKLISLLLVVCMLCSMGTAVFATTDYTNGTDVTYNPADPDGIPDSGDEVDNEAYTITVPATLAPGSSGTVTVEGTWASNRVLNVTADEKVTLTNSIDNSLTKELVVTFGGISKAGSNTVAIKTTDEGAYATVSVSEITNALFGTWSGTFYYNVEMENAATDDSLKTFVPGLYQTGAIAKHENGEDISDMLIKSWDELVSDGTIHVKNNSMYTNCQGIYGDSPINGSANALAGDLMIPNDGSITTLGILDLETEEMYVGLQLCNKLTGIFIPKSLTYGMTSDDIDGIPAEIILLQFPLFMGCSSLQKISVENGNPILYDEGNCLMMCATFTFDDEVFEVPPIVLAGCSNSTIPSNAKGIGMYAFAFQSGIESVGPVGSGADIEIPSSVESMGTGAFQCDSLKNVIVPAGSWGDASADCESIFWGCTNLETAVLLPGIEDIEDGAFADCPNLKAIYIPASVKYIMPDAFTNSPGITDVYYEGTAEQWANIQVYYNNGDMTRANIYYNSKLCSAQGGIRMCYGGTMTCTELAKCSACGKEYGTLVTHSPQNGSCTECGITVTVIESPHFPYGSNQNKTVLGNWDYTGAQSVTITIRYQTNTLSYDYIYLKSGDNYIDLDGNITTTATKIGGIVETTKTFTTTATSGSVLFTSDYYSNYHHGVTVQVTPNY